MSDIDRKPVKVSYWQFDPTGVDGDAQVEAMDSAVSVSRSDEDRVMLTVRGRWRGRYEKGDSAWLELSDAETLRLIERLAATLGKGPG